MTILHRIVLIASALVITGAATAAQTGQPSPRDISGFWALFSDGKKVPPAKLLPRVTKAMLDLHARQDVHAIRWCNPIGLPMIMDSGAIDIRQGPTAIFMAPESSLVPRYVYLNRKHVSVRYL